eukprot:gnl/Hemi2/26293_TR8826_c0_g1_i1.p1 gnl/Hemi2/26293_TR8826_c0_g1~~gnl/Hemi2/26293_TR8826_c0_g1_i1.p1  ORF type:complete len:223 (-),score=33.31 gnl/Hemi2/26293_TR8826_c0_g1_i1:59-727(-)
MSGWESFTDAEPNAQGYPTWLTAQPAGMSDLEFRLLQQPYFLFLQMYNRSSPMADELLRPTNVAWVYTQINEGLSKITGQKYVSSCLSDGTLASDMARAAGESSKLAYDPEAPARLSYTVVQHIIHDEYIGWRQQERYRQWVLEENRDWNIEYGDNSDQLERGQYRTYIGDYILSHPWRRAHPGYVAATTSCILNPRDGDLKNFFSRAYPVQHDFSTTLHLQ